MHQIKLYIFIIAMKRMFLMIYNMNLFHQIKIIHMMKILLYITASCVAAFWWWDCIGHMFIKQASKYDQMKEIIFETIFYIYRSTLKNFHYMLLIIVFVQFIIFLLEEIKWFSTDAGTLYHGQKFLIDRFIQV